MNNIHLWDALNHWYQEKNEEAQHQHPAQSIENEKPKRKSLPQRAKRVALAIAQLFVR